MSSNQNEGWNNIAVAWGDFYGDTLASRSSAIAVASACYPGADRAADIHLQKVTPRRAAKYVTRNLGTKSAQKIFRKLFGCDIEVFFDHHTHIEQRVYEATHEPTPTTSRPRTTGAQTLAEMTDRRDILEYEIDQHGTPAQDAILMGVALLPWSDGTRDATPTVAMKCGKQIKITIAGLEKLDDPLQRNILAPLMVRQTIAAHSAIAALNGCHEFASLMTDWLATGYFDGDRDAAEALVDSLTGTLRQD